MSLPSSQGPSQSQSNLSNTPQSQYSQLLVAVNDLRLDLEKALQQLATQTANNDTLRTLNERLTQDINDTQNKLVYRPTLSFSFIF